MASRPEAEERLARLQMMDLGSARREYVSTVDDPKKISRVNLEELEASRLSNAARGPEARFARQNQEKLAAWSNLHKTIGDSQNLEGLADIMSGQSHRANLNASIQAAGGQRPSGGSRGCEGSRKNHPLPASSFGRGGGIAGTRGRATSASASKPAGSEPHNAPRPRTQSSGQHLDPALDSNNDYVPPWGRGKRDHKGRPPRARRDSPEHERRPRPVVDFSRNLSTPEAFLAIARRDLQISEAAASQNFPRVASTVSQQVQAFKPISRSDVMTSTQSTPASSATAKTQVATPGTFKSPEKSVPPYRVAKVRQQVEASKSTPVSEVVAPNQSIPATSATPQPLAATSFTFKAPDPLNPAFHQSESGESSFRRKILVPVSRRWSKDTNTPAPSGQNQNIAMEKQAQQTDLPVVNLPPATTPTKQNVGNLDDQQKTASIEKKTPSGVLLDIDSGDEAPPSTLMTESPGCADLTGLEFSVPKAPHSMLTPTPSSKAKTEARTLPLPVLRKFVDTTHLTQQLVEQVSDVRDSVASGIVSALGNAYASPQLPNTSGSFVQDWLSRSPTRQAPVPSQASFMEYRSPASESSSPITVQHRSPGSPTPTLSPRNSVNSEGVAGLESLRLSPLSPLSQETVSFPPVASSRRGSMVSASTARASKTVPSLAESIYASPSRAKTPTLPALMPNYPVIKSADPSPGRTAPLGGPTATQAQPGRRATAIVIGVQPFTPRIGNRAVSEVQKPLQIVPSFTPSTSFNMTRQAPTLAASPYKPMTSSPLTQRQDTSIWATPAQDQSQTPTVPHSSAQQGAENKVLSRVKVIGPPAYVRRN